MGRRGRPKKNTTTPVATETDEEIDIQASSPPSVTAHREEFIFDEETFGGRLTEVQAERTSFTPTPRDARLFDASLPSAVEFTGKRRLMIDNLHFGPHHLRPWYSAPYPAEYFEGPEPGHLWMCERCLKYMRSRATFLRHLPKCSDRVPPGCEIYRKDEISVFEVNGRFSRDYCQRLCLLAKMFLDHKTLYYDVETFLFYILVEWHPVREIILEGRNEARNYSFVGYFSKEKQSPSDYNLSCIMTLPHKQRRGFGAFLMDFSYLLTRREGKIGSPEKPLSDLGLVGYVKYWSRIVSDVLLECEGGVSIQDIIRRTGMSANDVLATLEYLKAIWWDVRKERYVLKLVTKALQSVPPITLRADPECLQWQPYTCLR
ncbi:Histone acetyltransferase [Paramicrosporidium saccamoebae]|uniref:Histone acetyltransferase n=1 Tax=Paramicrosporidium saccamoebae TaxID=1246581 RepID=A0A2H9THL6_9FUNG|nr:Histone acetyltransferase [Paramicrosporidium saccamoebae]